MAFDLKIFTEFDNRAFVPGERISGRVEWRGGEIATDKAEVRLFFYTSGKGTRDVEIVETLRIENMGTSGEREFRFTIPENSPPSFSGKLISLQWALEFQIGSGGDTERMDITVSSTGSEILLNKYDDGNLPKYSDFSIGKKKRR